MADANHALKRGSNSAGFPRIDRDSERAYNYNHRRQLEDLWIDDMDTTRPEYQRPESNEKAVARNKQRMADFKGQEGAREKGEQGKREEPRASKT